jgi:hypothetical protein
VREGLLHPGELHKVLSHRHQAKAIPHNQEIPIKLIQLVHLNQEDMVLFHQLLAATRLNLVINPQQEECLSFRLNQAKVIPHNQEIPIKLIQLVHLNQVSQKLKF